MGQYSHQSCIPSSKELNMTNKTIPRNSYDESLRNETLYYPIPGDVIFFKEPVTISTLDGSRTGVREIRAKIKKESWSETTGTRTLQLHVLESSGFCSDTLMKRITRRHSSLFRKGSGLKVLSWDGPTLHRIDRLNHFLDIKEKGDREFKKRTGRWRIQKLSSKAVYKNKPVKKKKSYKKTYDTLENVTRNTKIPMDNVSTPSTWVRIPGTLRYAPKAIALTLPTDLIPDYKELSQ